MSRLAQEQRIQPHWWRKSLIGFIFGLALSYGMVAIFAWFGPGGIDAPVKAQLNMWLISAIWMPILAAIFLFRTAFSAFKWMLVANIAVYLLFALLWWLK